MLVFPGVVTINGVIGNDSATASILIQYAHVSKLTNMCISA